MTYPAKPEALALLVNWKDQHTAVVSLLDGIKESPFGLNPDGQMFNTVWSLFDTATEMLALLLGDSLGWLEWFQAENEMGARGHEAGYDGDLKPVKSLDDLYELIAESKKRVDA